MDATTSRQRTTGDAMQIGVTTAFSHLTPVDFIVGAAQRLEAAGFAAIWVPEHVVFFADYDSSYPYADDGRVPGDPEGVLDPFSALTFIAAHTSTIRLATGVCLVPQRQPLYTARVVADLDYLSGGRVDFGIGVGWLEEEFDALGMDFANRGPRTNEYIDAMKALWTQSPASFAGETVSFDGVHSNPKPVQSPHPPIFVGGESKPALRRIAAIADGWYGFDMNPDEFAERQATLDEYLEGADRDPTTIKRYVSPGRHRPDAATIDAYRDAGADQVVIGIGARSLDQLDDRIEALRTLAGLA